MTNTLYLTAAKYNQIISKSNERSVQLTSAELTSGGVSGSYSEVKNVPQFVDQELILNSVQSYKSSAIMNQERLGFVSTQLSNMRDIAIELQSRVSLLRSSPLANSEELSTWCNDKLDYITSVLNSRFDSKYTFSGTATNVPASRDLKSLPAMGVSDAVDPNLYYIGSTDDLIFRADDNTLIETPVRADDLGVAELIFSLRLCTVLPASEKDARLARANDLSRQAHEDLVLANNQLDNNRTTLQNVENSLSELEQTLTENIKELGYRTESEVLQDYVQSKTQLQLTRYVTTSSLNAIRDLIQQIPA